MEAEKGREVYRECMKNHAATLGTYASDGCGEFTLDETQAAALLCVACGCHRNFHRRMLALDRLMGSAETEGKRRPRTKFTAEQKAKMGWFAGRVGWRIPKGEAAAEEEEEDEVAKFCKEIGVTRQALKVWMHNHKSAASTSSAPVSPPLLPPPPARGDAADVNGADADADDAMDAEGIGSPAME